MHALRAAIFAALFLFGGVAAAQDVTFTSPDGSIEIEGNLLGFDGEFYRVETVYGELTLDASGVVCDGPGCPNLQAFVAEVRISGARGMADGLMPALIKGFAARGGMRVERQSLEEGYFVFELSSDARVVGRFEFRASNSDQGFADLFEDDADIIMSTREIRRAEAARAQELGLGDLTKVNRSRVIALDGLVPITAMGHPVTSMSIDDLSRVVAGQIVNWSELGGPEAPIELHLPATSTGLAQAVDDQLLKPRRRSVAETAIRHDNPGDITAQVGRDFLGLGITTFSAAEDVTAMTLSGPCGFSLRASRRSIKTEDYPLTAPLFLYLPARRLPKLARDFLIYARSDAAQSVIRQAGFVDQTVEAVTINAQGDRLANAILAASEEVPLTELKRMTETLSPRERLTTSFRFEVGSARLDAQSRSNVQHLARDLEAGRYDSRDLLFVGFSDGQGPAATNLRIAERRAAAVLQAVQEAAETANLDRVVMASDAFGEALPMACDDTAWGRSVNRRVEVWLR